MGLVVKLIRKYKQVCSWFEYRHDDDDDDDDNDNDNNNNNNNNKVQSTTVLLKM